MNTPSFEVSASVALGKGKFEPMVLTLPVDLNAPTPAEVKALVTALKMADSLTAWCTTESAVAEGVAFLNLCKVVGRFEGSPRPGHEAGKSGNWPVFLSRLPGAVDGNALLSVLSRIAADAA